LVAGGPRGGGRGGAHPPAPRAPPPPRGRGGGDEEARVVVVRLERIRTEVDDLGAGGAKPPRKLFLQREPAVIGRDSDAHFLSFLFYEDRVKPRPPWRALARPQVVVIDLAAARSASTTACS